MSKRFGYNVSLYDRIYFELLRATESEFIKFRKLKVANFELADLYAGFSSDNTYFIGIRVDESRKALVDKALKDIGNLLNLKTHAEKGRQGTYIGKIYVPMSLINEKFLDTEKRMGRICT